MSRLGTVALGIVASRNGRSRNGRVRNGRSRIDHSMNGTSTDIVMLKCRAAILKRFKKLIALILKC